MTPKWPTKHHSWEKFEHGVDTKFKNNKDTTTINFDFTVSRGIKQVNIFNRHKKIFEAMKLDDNSTKMITTAGKTFEYP